MSNKTTSRAVVSYGIGMAIFRDLLHHPPNQVISEKLCGCHGCSHCGEVDDILLQRLWAATVYLNGPFIGAEEDCT